VRRPSREIRRNDIGAVWQVGRDATLRRSWRPSERFFRFVGSGTFLVVVAAAGCSLTMDVAVGTAAFVVVCAAELAVASLRYRDVLRQDAS